MLLSRDGSCFTILGLMHKVCLTWSGCGRQSVAAGDLAVKNANTLGQKAAVQREENGQLEVNLNLGACQQVVQILRNHFLLQLIKPFKSCLER